MFDPAMVGEEVFGTLRSFNYAVAIFDEEGNRTEEPKEGLRFFTDSKNITVSLHIDGENSALHVYLGNTVDLEEVQGMLDTLRRSATKYGILFNARKYRREIGPKDFANGGTVLESRKLEGSTKSSYLKLENARMIVRHAEPVDDSKHGARGRNVRKVMIENKDGERHLMPSQHLMAGRAMTRHVSKGGHWGDDVGQKINEMAAQHQHMKTCAAYCRQNRKKLDEDVMQIVEVCTSRAKHLRNVFEGLYRRYDKTLKELEKEPDNLLLEDGDDDVLEERVKTLMKKLQLEDESVVDRPTCKSVVRVLGENALLEKKEDMVFLQALDCNVEASAWEAFKDDPPSIKFIDDMAPDVSPAGKNAPAALTLVANRCAQDAFANMLAQVSQWLEDGKTDVLLKHIAFRATYVARHHPNKAPPQELVKNPTTDNETKPLPAYEGKKGDLRSGIIVTESVEALAAWFESFDVDSMFEDDEGSRFPKLASEDEIAGQTDNSFATVEADFNVDDFLVMHGDDFNYGDSEIEKEVEATYLLSSLKHYLNNEIENDLSASVEVTHNDFGDLSVMAKRLLPQVVSRLEEEGYTVTGMDALETDDDDDDGLAVDAGNGIKFSDDILDEAMSADDRSQFKAYLRGCTDSQVQGCYDKENEAGRRDYADLCVAEAERRGISLHEQQHSDGFDDNEEVLLGGEEDDLAGEDILLPVNPTDDLKRDIKADPEQDGDEDDTDHINRILTLAGRRRMDVTITPRPPQP